MGFAEFARHIFSLPLCSPTHTILPQTHISFKGYLFRNSSMLRRRRPCYLSWRVYCPPINQELQCLKHLSERLTFTTSRSSMRHLAAPYRHSFAPHHDARCRGCARTHGWALGAKAAL